MTRRILIAERPGSTVAFRFISGELAHSVALPCFSRATCATFPFFLPLQLPSEYSMTVHIPHLTADSEYRGDFLRPTSILCRWVPQFEFSMRIAQRPVIQSKRHPACVSESAVDRPTLARLRSIPHGPR